MLAQHHNRGIGVVEIVVVVGIAGIIMLSIFQLVVVATRPISVSTREAEATYLAEEALEAVRLLRNESWTDKIASLTDSTTYYPVIVASAWTLTTTNPGPLNGTYTRTIVIRTAVRDSSDNISTTGTSDPKTKRVTATVSWLEHGQAKSVILETYITNFLGT
jgi:type II secretory pathway pseudopilin PulG